MKRLFVLVLVLLFGASALFAQDVLSGWDSHFKAGNTSLSLGVGVSYWGSLGIAAYPGFEQTIMDFKIADEVPIAIGLAARGLVNPYAWSTYAGINIGAGIFVPFHFGLKGLDIEFFDKLDFYAAFGVSFTMDLGNYPWTDPFRIGFNSYDGFNYFISDSFAVYAEYNYWGYYSGGSIGVVLKL